MTLVSSQYLAEATEHDPQMQLPTHPRLPEDLLKIWFNQQTLIITGGVSDVVLRGKAVSELLQQLVPLLNGQRTVAEICALLSAFPATNVRDALTLLYMQGVLEEGPGDQAGLDAAVVRQFGAQLKFYSRYVDQTRMQRNRYSVLRSLQDSAVVLISSARLAPSLSSALANLGLGHLRLLLLDAASIELPSFATMQVEAVQLDLNAVPLGWSQLASASADANLLVFAADAAHAELLNRLNRFAVDQGLRFLPAHIHADAVELGPLYFPDESCCYECARLQQELRSTSAPASADASLALNEQIGVSQTALMVLSALTNLVQTQAANTIYRLNNDTLELEAQTLYRLLGCPVCATVNPKLTAGDLLVGPEHSEQLPLLYHFDSADQSYLHAVRTHQQHYLSKNVKASTGGFKQYATRERIDLRPYLSGWPSGFDSPMLPQLPPAMPIGTQPTLRDLTWLCLTTFSRYVSNPELGWEQGQRLTPSGGNLSSQTLYVVNRSIADLAAGLYHVNPSLGALEILHTGPVYDELNAAVPDAGSLPANTVGALIITGLYGRLESKYGKKAYRYTLYDGGVLLHSLASVAPLLGLEVWQAAAFDDDAVRSLLAVHAIDELPLYVVYLVAPQGMEG